MELTVWYASTYGMDLRGLDFNGIVRPISEWWAQAGGELLGKAWQAVERAPYGSAEGYEVLDPHDAAQKANHNRKGSGSPAPRNLLNGEPGRAARRVPGNPGTDRAARWHAVGAQERVTGSGQEGPFKLSRTPA
jgi:hypothetical protein